MTYMQAALTILAHADRPLTIGEITAVAVAHGLVRPRGKTPDRTMSSVLYRRMALDADAPIISRGARFWLRGRPLPVAEETYLTQRARRSRPDIRRGRGTSHVAQTEGARRATVLPPPPLQLPDDAISAAFTESRPAADYAPVRRERAIVRAGERGARLLARLEARRSGASQRGRTRPEDAERTATRLIVPLLMHLRYRPGIDALPIEHAGRGMTAYLLHAAGEPVIALDVRALGHDLDDDDAWRALSRAQERGARYAAVTNGWVLRLYSVSAAEAQDDLVAALVLVLDLAPAPAGSAACDDQAAALWLLSRDAVAAGALDSYAADCAIGAALLDALDEPDSALARALVAEVRSRVGVALPSDVVLRHARLVVRGRRGRAGEPLPEDVAAVAAVRGPRLRRSLVEIVQSA